MKLTDKHVSDEWIDTEIKILNNFGLTDYHTYVMALLELKHRRAEDRMNAEKASDNG